MCQELLRRRSYKTSTSAQNLLPTDQPQVFHSNSQRHLSPALQSQYLSTLQQITPQESTLQDSFSLNSHASVSEPALPSVVPLIQQSTRPQVVMGERLKSPKQMELLQGRSQQKIAAKKKHVNAFQSHAHAKLTESLSCTSPSESTGASSFAVFSKRNSAIRRPSLSPAMTTFTVPQTTSYATPLRRRKALLVGIGYQGHRFLRPLPGCKNDVRNVFNLLTGPLFGFSKDNIRILCDEIESLDGVEPSMPTRVNILRCFHWLTVDVTAGDSVVFFFAGHGDFVEDLSGDEVESGFDQVRTDLVCF